MFEFGDELTIIDSFNTSISWLISIQLFAMLLLFILLYHLTLTTSDHLPTATATATAPPPATALPSITSADSNNRHNSKTRENEIKETRSSISGVVQRAKKPDARQRTEPSTTNEGSDMMFQHSHHPCHFFGFAKQAFLKCLGIDTNRERPHEKDD